MLYTALPLSYISGFYRLMCSRSFAKEIAIGFGLDVVLTLALFFVQMLNNSTLNSFTIEKDLASSDFEFICIIIKLMAIGDISIELFMFIYEIYKKKYLESKSVDVFVVYNEE